MRGSVKPELAVKKKRENYIYSQQKQPLLPREYSDLFAVYSLIKLASQNCLYCDRNTKQGTMVNRIQDLNLPNAVVGRLIKEVLPDHISVGKEFRVAIARAASVFVIYLSSAATAEAKKANMKTISSNHVFDALDEIEFESFIEPLKEALELYRENVKDKKDKKKDTAATTSKEADNDVEEIEDD